MNILLLAVTWIFGGVKVTPSTTGDSSCEIRVDVVELGRYLSELDLEVDRDKHPVDELRLSLDRAAVEDVSAPERVTVENRHLNLSRGGVLDSGNEHALEDDEWHGPMSADKEQDAPCGDCEDAVFVGFELPMINLGECRAYCASGLIRMVDGRRSEIGVVGKSVVRLGFDRLEGVRTYDIVEKNWVGYPEDALYRPGDQVGQFAGSLEGESDPGA